MKTKIFILLLLATMFQCHVLSQQKDSLQTKYNIKNCVNQFDTTKVSTTKVGYQYWFADKNLADGRTLKLSVVKPNSATHPPHKHEEDEFFFILEGEAKLYLDGDSVVCGPMTSFYCPPMVAHSIRNIGKTELKYLVIKDYK